MWHGDLLLTLSAVVKLVNDRPAGRCPLFPQPRNDQNAWLRRAAEFELRPSTNHAAGVRQRTEVHPGATTCGRNGTAYKY